MRVKLLIPVLLVTFIPWISGNKLNQLNFDEPVHELHGTYLVKERDHESGRPGWASVWPIEKREMSFGVYFWPPKYCHAIYICPVKDTPAKMGRFDQFSCDDMYIKFYPHIQKLFFKKDVKTAEQEVFYVEPSLQFQRTGNAATTSTYKIKALKTNPIDHEDWLSMKSNPKSQEELQWDLTGYNLMILTNSRMCEVHKPGSSFYPLFDGFDPNTQLDATTTANWPKWLVNPSVQQTQHVPTLALPQLGGSKKTVDLLNYLKDLTQEKTLGKVNQRCPNFEKVGVQAARKPVFERSMHVSVASFDVSRPSVQPGAPWTFQMEFTMSKCKWIRFWASEKGMDTYATEMKIEDTLDLFIQEGFMIPPDTDTPIPLPDIQLMSQMKFTVMRGPPKQNQNGGTDDHDLIEFAFGEVNSVYLFRQFFKSAAFGKANTKIHMIRSPKCESNLVIDTGLFNDPGKKRVNMKDVKLCTYTALVDKAEVKRINDQQKLT